MKNTIVFILMLCICNHSYSQEKELVLNFLENKLYAEKSDVEFIIDNQKIEIPEGLLTDIETGMQYGLDNSHVFNKSSKSKMMSNTYDASFFERMQKKPSHYLVILKILYLDLIEKENGGDYKFSADIKCLDLINGTNIIHRNVSTTGTYSNKADITYSSSKLSQDIAKRVREATTKSIKNKFPIANFVISLGEVKGDKVKSVATNSLRYAKQGKPKYAYAHIVDKEIEVDGKTIYLFELVGNLSQPKKIKSEIHYRVSDGKKQLLAAFNEGKDIYITKAPLGPGL